METARLSPGETDVDCGGLDCGPCEDKAACAAGSDCLSGVCDAEEHVCTAKSCTDGVINFDETDVDCGGPKCPGCIDGAACASDVDCLSGACHGLTRKCVPASCTDGELSPGETDVDCGGEACGPCLAGESCTRGDDCSSALCFDGTCAPSTCRDGILSGTETDVDCGGGCGPCSALLRCAGDGDCDSGHCDSDARRCLDESCVDGVQNGDEVDVDCGGERCLKCKLGALCQISSDCRSGFCDPAETACAPLHCGSGVMDGDETDVDCGGPSCAARCPLSAQCATNADCASGFCSQTERLACY